MVADILDSIASWPTFLAALLIFGFAPRAVLRVIVLAFPRDSPRRREILAEIHAVPRIERPFWVAEQLEVAINEGVRERVIASVRRHGAGKWGLANVSARHGTTWRELTRDPVAMERGAIAEVMIWERSRKGFTMHLVSVRLTEVHSDTLKGNVVWAVNSIDPKARIRRGPRVGDRIEFTRSSVTRLLRAPNVAGYNEFLAALEDFVYMGPL